MLEFTLENNYKVIIKKEGDELIAEYYDDKGEFLERNRTNKEDIYMELIY